MRNVLRTAITLIASLGLAISATAPASATSVSAPIATAAIVVTDLPSGTPSEGDIAAAKAHEAKTQSSIADLEVQLADLTAQSLAAQAQADTAQAALDEAQEKAEQAGKDAEAAQRQADDAKVRVEEGRASLASVAQAMYQNNASTLTSAYMLLGADSLQEAAIHERSYHMVATDADQKLKAFQALENVAASLQKIADQKLKDQQVALEAADIAADDAAAAAAEAQALVGEADAQRDSLLGQLAVQKNTTKELEAKRFVALENERIAREKAEAEARAKAEAAAAAAAAAQAAAQAQASKAQKSSPAPAPQASTSPQASSKSVGSKPIVDMSSWQSPSRINYDQLAANISGAILRIGYTGQASGSSVYKDTAFDRHYAELTKRGVPVGVYWYSCANTNAEAVNEAKAALSYLGGRSLSFPVYIDVEDPKHQSGQSMSTLTNASLQFAATVKSGGYRPGVYSSASWFGYKLNHGTLAGAGLSIWIAKWSSAKPSYSYGLWQYTDNARLPGYSGPLDANRLG